jgi:hypothetical protein
MKTAADIMLVQMNAEQLGQLIESKVRQVVSDIVPEHQQSRQYARSLKEFADIIGRDKTTVQRWKNEGALDGALYQYGHSVTVDVDKAFETLARNGKTKRLQTKKQK